MVAVMTIDLAKQLGALTPADRARLIYGRVQNQLFQQLWQAALGTSDDAAASQPASDFPMLDTSLDLESLLTAQGQPDVSAPAPARFTDSGGTLALGVNAVHGPAIEAAAARTGIPAPALAAIIDAEAAKGADGAWNPASRNPRSSATGLTQFLAGTWEAEAERSGTHLNEVARSNGWLDSRGRVSADSRAALLDLRLSPRHAIEAAADYARLNLEQLTKSGVTIDTSDAAQVARLAYLGHHLGPADAVRFARGEIGSARAKLLLASQVGNAEASRRMTQAGDAVTAHRTWLNGYMDRRIVPARFIANA